MFRAFIVLIEISILVVIFQLPFVQYFLSDVHNGISDWMTEWETREEREQLADIKQSLELQYSTLRPYQQNYFNDILSSRASTRQFYNTYCMKSDKNPYIYGATLSSLCSAITASPVLKSKNS